MHAGRCKHICNIEVQSNSRQSEKKSEHSIAYTYNYRDNKSDPKKGTKQNPFKARRMLIIRK